MSRLYPSDTADSAYSINYKKEYENGIRAVFFDVDNTLVMHDAPATDKAKGLFEELRAIGLKTCIISNNSDKRVRPFAQMVGSQYICKAGKPSAKGYIEAMKLTGTDTKTALFIGDQIFTDIYGANRAGIRNYLVNPINPREEIQIVLKRLIEKPVLYFYKKKQKRGKR